MGVPPAAKGFAAGGGVLVIVPFRWTLGKYRASARVAVSHNTELLAACPCCVGPQ